MEKKVIVGDKEHTIKEIKYKDAVKLSEISKEEAAKQMIILGTDMTEEEYDKLSIKDGVELQQAINDVNGLTDFQQPLK